MSEIQITSPCLSICKTDPVSGYCYGCGRTDDDKKKWNDEKTTNEWKIANIDIIRNRLSGWQKNAFDKSYQYKKENGISLFKKNNLK